MQCWKSLTLYLVPRLPLSVAKKRREKGVLRYLRIRPSVAKPNALWPYAGLPVYLCPMYPNEVGAVSGKSQPETARIELYDASVLLGCGKEL